MSEPNTSYKIKSDATISFAKAYLIAILFLFVVGIIYWLPYFLIWKNISVQNTLHDNATVIIYFLIIFIGVVLHEMLHAFGFIYFGKVNRKQIQFGFNWKAVSAYAHCKEPVTAMIYRKAVILPGIILGLIPCLLGIALNFFWGSFYGFIMLVAAGGDLAILIAIRSVPSDTKVLDHPTKAGCYILEAE